MLWNSAYETGIPVVDAQHQELFHQLDILIDSKDPSAVPKVLEFLGGYVVKHFNTEEQLQRESAYPDFPEHKKKHVAFVDAYKRLNTEYQNSGQNPLILMKLTRVALDWLKQHIRVEDKTFAKHYLSVHPDAKAKAASGAGPKSAPRKTTPEQGRAVRPAKPVRAAGLASSAGAKRPVRSVGSPRSIGRGTSPRTPASSRPGRIGTVPRPERSSVQAGKNPAKPAGSTVSELPGTSRTKPVAPRTEKAPAPAGTRAAPAAKPARTGTRPTARRTLIGRRSSAQAARTRTPIKPLTLTGAKPIEKPLPVQRPAVPATPAARKKEAAPTPVRRSPAANARAIPLTPDEEATAATFPGRKT